MNNSLTSKEINELNCEINKFWGEPDSNVNNFNYEYMLMTYEKLCEKLPFIPFSIIGNKIFMEGEIPLPFFNAFFYAIGVCCKKYNNREYHIVYTNE